ncbi:MAG: hypothetical protein ACRDQB_16395, partial [Thermocrispum sp.]
MAETSPRRVGSSGAAMAVSGVQWLLLPTGWPTLVWFVLLGVTLSDSRPDCTWPALALLALPAHPPWRLWWRFAGVSARRLPGTYRTRRPTGCAIGWPLRSA